MLAPNPGGSGPRFGFNSPGQAPLIRPPPPQLLQDQGLASAAQPEALQPAFTPYYLRPAYRFKPQTVIESELNDSGPGRRLRRNLANVRRPVDYTANILTHLEDRIWQRDWRDRRIGAPDLLYSRDVLPTSSYRERPIDCVLTKFLRAAMNKIKCPIYDICWTPEGRRLITGASTGEFTLWNGTAFNFETILQAHDTAIRALKWSHSEKWLVSADHDGFIKYWQANMNNVHMFQAHKEAVRSISFSCTDVKMATGSDDGTVRVWDFNRCAEERILRGHGSDVRSVDWHPQKGLLASGSRDSQQPVKLWDPKTGQCLATLHDHKNSAMGVEWNRNGNWLLTASRDHLIKLYDIRMMREIRSFRGHKKEVTAIAWHPIHEGLFVSGGGDGSLAYWLATSDKEAGLIEHAHDQAIWTLEWHPLGHILASGSNDNNTKFWTRNKPGDLVEDFHGMLAAATTAGALSGPNATQQLRDKIPETPGEKLARNQAALEAERLRKEEAEREGRERDGAVGAPIPGMGLDKDVLETLKKAPAALNDGIPGLGATLFPDNPIPQQQVGPSVGAKRTLIKQPPPKKAQRQLERLWNASKPMGQSGADAPDEDATPGAVKRGKKSLLGRAPPPQSQPMEPGPSGMPFNRGHMSGPPGGMGGGWGGGNGGQMPTSTGMSGPMSLNQQFGGPPGPPMPPPGPPPPGMFGGMGGGRMGGNMMMTGGNATQMLGPMWQVGGGGGGPEPPQAPPVRDVDYRFQQAPSAPIPPTGPASWAAPSVDEDWRGGVPQAPPTTVADPRDPRQRRREEAPPPSRDPRATRRPGNEEEAPPPQKRNWMGELVDADPESLRDAPPQTRNRSGMSSQLGLGRKPQ